MNEDMKTFQDENLTDGDNRSPKKEDKKEIIILSKIDPMS